MLFVAAALVSLLALVLTSCGGGSSASSSESSATNASSTTGESTAKPSLGASAGAEVARVGATPITLDQVSHWMGTLAGGDYYELSRRNKVPADLVSDPPRYQKCVAQLEAAAAAAPQKLYTVTGVQLLTKCRQLYQAMRSQAAEFIVHALYVMGLGESLGVSVSDAEVLKAYKANSAERFPVPAEEARYLSGRRATLSDELLVAKLDVLSAKILAAVKAKGSGGQAALGQAEASWRAKTDCKAGYVVEYCKQFHGEPPRTPNNPPPSVLMEQIAAIALGRCTNLPACGKP